MEKKPKTMQEWADYFAQDAIKRNTLSEEQKRDIRRKLGLVN